MAAALADLLEGGLGVGEGGGGLALPLAQETEQLLRRHVRAAAGVGREGLPHVRRRLRLLRPELAGEAEAHLVAPHERQLREKGIWDEEIDESRKGEPMWTEKRGRERERALYLGRGEV